MAESDVPKKPGDLLVPKHLRGTLRGALLRQGFDPVTGRRLGTGELTPSSSTPINPLSARFGAGPASLETFRKPSDLITQAEEPTLEDIRRVLKSQEHFLTATALPTDENQNPTASSLAEYDRIRRKHGSQSLRWEEGWEEAGRELGFKTDPELRVLINQIYAPAERDLETRPDFWSLEEGPQFEQTVQNIRNLRAQRWDNDKQAYKPPSDRLAKFREEASTEVSTVKKERPTLSASQMLQQFKERVASGISRVAEAVSREPEKPPAAQAVERIRTDKVQNKENLAVYRDAFTEAGVAESENLSQSLIPNRSGNFKRVSIRKGEGFGKAGSVAAYRGYLLESDYVGDTDKVEWAITIPEEPNYEGRQKLAHIGDYLPWKDMKEAIDDLWDLPGDHELSPHKRLDGRLVSQQTKAELVAQESAELKERAERFEKIRTGEFLSPQVQWNTDHSGGLVWEVQTRDVPRGQKRLLIVPGNRSFAATLARQGIPDNVTVAIVTPDKGLVPIQEILGENYTGQRGEMEGTFGAELLQPNLYGVDIEGNLREVNKPVISYWAEEDKEVSRRKGGITSEEASLLLTKHPTYERIGFPYKLAELMSAHGDVLVAGGAQNQALIEEALEQTDFSDKWLISYESTTGLNPETGKISAQYQHQQVTDWLRKSHGDGLDEALDQLLGVKPWPTDRGRGPSLQDFVRKKGISRFSVDALGLRGEIEHLELESDRKPGQKLVVRDDGMDMDEIVEAATAAGYLDEGQDWETRPSINDFLEVLSDSMRDPVYSFLEEDQQAVAQEEYLNDLQRELDERVPGDHSVMSYQEMRNQLKWSYQDQGRKEDQWRTEKTEAGEQALVPGVDPVTTRDILEVEADRPLSGGPVDEGPLFDLEARTQLDIEDVPQVEEDPRMVEELGVIIDPSIGTITKDAEPEFETTGEPPLQLHPEISGNEDLVQKSLNITKKGTYPQVKRGSVTYYRGFAIRHIPKRDLAYWDNDKQDYITPKRDSYEIIPPVKDTGNTEVWQPPPHVTFKYEATRFIDKLWEKNPKIYESLIKDLGFKAPIKKAYGGFIDKPLYNRSL